MSAERHRSRRPRASARFRLALSYALFLVAAGFIVLVGTYIVVRYVPDYPLTAANPRDSGTYVASRQEILTALVSVSGIILLALAVIGFTGGWILAGWILRPLQRINAAAEIAATGRLDHRINLSGRNDEFRQLADTFDYMVARLHDAFVAQERFAANASHELRTPLAVSATLLDVARKNPNQQDYTQLIERLSSTNARAIGLTEALLRLANANSITATSEPVDLACLARDAINEAAADARRRDVRVDCRLGAAPTVGDAVLLEQLVRNLIQNAIVHNCTPGNAHVATTYDPSGRSVILRVENAGAIYSHEEAARLSEPFLRGSGRISQPGRQEGYGLGLAIVERITTVHNGTLSLIPRNGGGLIVTVTLPGPPQTTRSFRNGPGTATFR